MKDILASAQRDVLAQLSWSNVLLGFDFDGTLAPIVRRADQKGLAEISNETAGEHFTPREVIRLMVNLIFIEDDDVLSKPGVVRTIYDPTAGTGGMLSVAGEYLEEHNPQARLTVFGQELNPESHAICKADMLIKGQDVANIVFGIFSQASRFEKLSHTLRRLADPATSESVPVCSRRLGTQYGLGRNRTSATKSASRVPASS